MKIKAYLDLLEREGLALSHNSLAEDNETEIENLAYHTAKVTKNTLFICKGAAFKPEYARSAVTSGAVLLVCDGADRVCGIDDTAVIIVSDIRKAMSCLASFHYNNPERELFSVGITGTKGKTTSAYFIKSIIDDFESMREGKGAAIFSSIDNYYGGESEVSHLTTPESPDLFKYMRSAVTSGIKYLVMEASSQGLKYDRVDRMHFSVGIFLNISKDHISPREHPDFEDYFASKLKIFDISDKLVINLDSDRADDIRKRLEGREYVTYSMTDDSADYYAFHIKSDRDFTTFRVRDKVDVREFRIGMKGDFNVSNALAAIAAMDIAGIPTTSIRRGLMKARVDGRMEFFSSSDEKINVIVDYAHNRLSFDKLFASLHKEFPGKECVAVFGCPGYKAYDRRSDLAEISAKNCSFVYLTEEDPGDEPPEDITKDIASHFPEGYKYKIDNNRERAIIDAIDTFGENALIVITGKGRERTQRRGKVYEDCKSDVDIVNEYIEKYNTQKTENNSK